MVGRGGGEGVVGRGEDGRVWLGGVRMVEEDSWER